MSRSFTYIPSKIREHSSNANASGTLPTAELTSKSTPSDSSYPEEAVTNAFAAAAAVDGPWYMIPMFASPFPRIFMLVLTLNFVI